MEVTVSYYVIGIYVSPQTKPSTVFTTQKIYLLFNLVPSFMHVS